MLNPIAEPRGVFCGQNFMTPIVYGYYKLAEGRGYAELSKGTGIRQESIFGVTVRNGRGEDPERLSQMFYSEREAREYIEELS